MTSPSQNSMGALATDSVAGTIKIVVESAPTGKHAVPLRASDTVADLHAKIRELTGWDATTVCLVCYHDATLLEPLTATLAECKIVAGSTVYAKKDFARCTDGTAVLVNDPWLEGSIGALQSRYQRYQKLKHEIEKNEGSLANFASSYERFGLHRVKGGFEYKEYAPAAKEVRTDLPSPSICQRVCPHIELQTVPEGRSNFQRSWLGRLVRLRCTATSMDGIESRTYASATSLGGGSSSCRTFPMASLRSSTAASIPLGTAPHRSVGGHSARYIAPASIGCQLVRT